MTKSTGLETEPLWVNEILVFEDLDFFVVINTTPFAALDPYMADAEASFNTLMDSISLELITFNIFLDPPTPPESNGIPSTTYNGLEFRFNDPVPLILIFEPSPGAPPLEVTVTPETFPWINCCAEEFATLLKSSAER